MNREGDVDFSKLLGFEQLGDVGEIDFRDHALGAKLGAKRGEAEVTARPVEIDDQSQAG